MSEPKVSRRRPLGAFAWAMASIVSAAALCAGYRLVTTVSPFVLGSVRVAGAERTGRDEVIRAGGRELIPGAQLFKLDLGEIRRAVEELPWVRECRVSRRLPSTLDMELREWRPQYLVRFERLYYLTREGHVVRAPLEQGLDYPVVTGLTADDLERSSPLKRSLLGLLALLDQGAFVDELSEINADPVAGFTLYTPSSGGTGTRIGLAAFERKFDRLGRLRRHLSRRGQAARAVDLTYEDKIIARLVSASGEDSRP